MQIGLLRHAVLIEQPDDVLARDEVLLEVDALVGIASIHREAGPAAALAQADAKLSELKTATNAELEEERSKRHKVEVQVRLHEEQAEAARLHRKNWKGPQRAAARARVRRRGHVGTA